MNWRGQRSPRDSLATAHVKESSTGDPDTRLQGRVVSFASALFGAMCRLAVLVMSNVVFETTYIGAPARLLPGINSTTGS
jgi:hypothetical protein